MKPITFSCRDTLPIAPDALARQFLDLTKWPDFHGYGPIPGIQVAEFEFQTPGIVGSRIRVRNRDGSCHVEEVVEWEPDRRIRLRMKEFSAPLSRLATRFEETWELHRVGNATTVIRSFQMYSTSALARPLLWIISVLLKRAVMRHLRQMRDDRASQEQRG